MKELAPGLHRWTARHPDWHLAGDGFGAEVASFAANTTILITIGYHVRSAAALSARYGAAIRGPAQAGRRLDATKAFTLLEPGTPGPAGVVAHAIGRPRRGETPLWLPSHDAVAFGDALVTTPDGALRRWCQEPLDDRRRAFYRDRFAPTLDPLIGRAPKRVLPTHGPPVLTGGAAALRDAVAAGPWYHRG
jgi:hypothetical protein